MEGQKEIAVFTPGGYEISVQIAVGSTDQIYQCWNAQFHSAIFSDFCEDGQGVHLEKYQPFLLIFIAALGQATSKKATRELLPHLTAHYPKDNGSTNTVMVNDFVHQLKGV